MESPRPPISTPENSSSNLPTVPEAVIEPLRKTKPWVRFLSILGFIGVAFIVVMSVAVMFMSSTIPAESSPFSFSFLAMIPHLIMSALYFFPALFLFRYASSINSLVNGGGLNNLQDALEHQKSFWRFVGMLALVGIVIGSIGIVAAIVIPQLVGQ